MKTLVIVFLISLLNLTFSQEMKNKEMFSEFNLNFQGGANFNTFSAMGGSLLLGGRTNLNSKIDLTFSAGYSKLLENSEYLIKSYDYFKIENTEGYQLNTYYINQLDYSIFPVNLGLEYKIFESNITPSALFEIGYNFYNREEQVSKTMGSSEIYENKNDIPHEYLNSPPIVKNDSFFNFGFGVGFDYKISSGVGLNIRYIYKINNSIINTYQILVGITL